MSAAFLAMFGAVLADAFFAAVAATGFALISNPPRKALPWLALLAALAHSLRFFLMNYAGFGISTATLAATLSMGCGAVVLTRRLHIPAEFFSFPALLPMIPGMYAYKTMLALLRFMDAQDSELRLRWLLEISHNGLTTFFVMCALVIGTLVPLYVFHKNSWLMSRLCPQK